VMIKIGKPKGLIRYASYTSIKEGVQKLFTARVLGYTFVLMVLVGILSFTIATRSDVKTTVLKVPGTLYQRTADGYITNLYNIEFVNKTFDDIQLDIRVEAPSSATLEKADGKQIMVKAEGMVKNVIFIKIPEKQVLTARTVVNLGVYRNNERIETIKVKFIGPVTKSSDMNSRMEDE
jgi:polyferredoxin